MHEGHVRHGVSRFAHAAFQTLPGVVIPGDLGATARYFDADLTVPAYTAPDGIINRAQMVTMLYRAAGSPEVEGASAFTDISADSYYAKAAAWAAKIGITAGVGNGRFEPNGTCTRGQIATFLYRYMK